MSRKIDRYLEQTDKKIIGQWIDWDTYIEKQIDR